MVNVHYSPANGIPAKYAKPRAPNMSPTPREALSLPTRSSATTALSKTNPLSKEPYSTISATKISKSQAPEIRAVELATPIMATWNICTRWDRNLSASLPVTREKKKDDIDQAMIRIGALSFDTPVSLEKAG